MGQRQHDVAADVLKPGLPRPGQRLAALCRSVGAAQAGKAVWAGGLHPKADSVHARVAVTGKRLEGDGLGVCLQRHFGPGQGACRIHQAAYLGGGEQAGRPAAEIQGVRPQRRLPATGHISGHGPRERLHISVRYAPAAAFGIKIAIAALCQTVGDVQIKPERHRASPTFTKI